ncbi:hypothetical protein QBC35DRAFT_548451 [Podospora australis]|uniref:Uncharacterized protein n=1 Tax=Podospora australis TaxID=1536484 RepID=A0AAN6WYG6_9PEZI|nr:hypothetical protein QBC35DRAFT_548451 [Podospora australis]
MSSQRPGQGHQGSSRLPRTTTPNQAEVMAQLKAQPSEVVIERKREELEYQCRNVQAKLQAIQKHLHSEGKLSGESANVFEGKLQALTDSTKHMYLLGHDMGVQLSKARRLIKHLAADNEGLRQNVQDFKEVLQEKHALIASYQQKDESEDASLVEELRELLARSEAERQTLQLQLEGKRSLWMRTHTDHQEQAAALAASGPSAQQIALRPKGQLAHTAPREAEDWEPEFSRLFTMVKGYCKLFENSPVPIAHLENHVRTRAADLWNHMARILHPADLKVGEKYLGLAIRNDAYRQHLLTRVILQYLVNSLFSPEGWEGFSPDLDAELKDLSRKLMGGRGVQVYKSHERQALLDRRTSLVSQILASEHGEAFQSDKKAYHTSCIQTMISPFTSAGNTFEDVAGLVNRAWVLSREMWLSGLMFIFTWNDPGAKFSPESHLAIADNSSAVKGTHGWKIKLAVTPSVVVREDRNMTIKTTPILKSKVLVN